MKNASQKERAKRQIYLILFSFFLPILVSFFIALPSIITSDSFLQAIAGVIISLLVGAWNLAVYGGPIIFLFLWGFILALDLGTPVNLKKKNIVSLLNIQNKTNFLFFICSLLIIGGSLRIFPNPLKLVLLLEVLLLAGLIMLTYKKSKAK